MDAGKAQFAGGGWFDMVRELENEESDEEVEEYEEVLE